MSRILISIANKNRKCGGSCVGGSYYYNPDPYGSSMMYLNNNNNKNNNNKKSISSYALKNLNTTTCSKQIRSTTGATSITTPTTSPTRRRINGLSSSSRNGLVGVNIIEYNNNRFQLLSLSLSLLSQYKTLYPSQQQPNHHCHSNSSHSYCTTSFLHQQDQKDEWLSNQKKQETTMVDEDHNQMDTTTNTTTKTNPKQTKNRIQYFEPMNSSEQSDEWIPPNRPLVGDLGQSNLYVNEQYKMNQDESDQYQEEIEIIQYEKELNEEILFEKELQAELLREQEELREIEVEIQRLEELEIENIKNQKKKKGKQQQIRPPPSNEGTKTPDWLQLRRSIYGNDDDNTTTTTNINNNKNTDAVVVVSGGGNEQTQGTATRSNKEKNSNIDTLIATNGIGQDDDLVSDSDNVESDKKPKTNYYSEDIIPMKLHTLLSHKEIIKCIHATGGQEIILILDDPDNKRMMGPLGLIVVTANNTVTLRRIADVLVRQLRKRELQHLNVVGASLGIEGEVDDNSTSDQQWLVVDCYNYVVHVQDEQTRLDINLEAIWSGEDPLFTVNPHDEDAVDQYVEAYPVPDHYNLHSGYSSKRAHKIITNNEYGGSGSGTSSSGSGTRTGATILSFTDTLQRLQKTRYTVESTPRSKPTTKRNRMERQRDRRRRHF